MKQVSIYFLLIGIVLCGGNLQAQTVRLKILAPHKKSEVNKLNYQKTFSTKSAALKELENVLLTLQYKGYLLASVDTLYSDSSLVTAKVSENRMFKTVYLRLGNLNPSLASKLGISEKLYFDKPFKYKEVARSFEKIVRYYENNGYPFVSVKLDSIEVNEEELRAQLNVEKNKLFKIDSIKLEGSAKVNRGFLNRYLSVKEGMPYNEQTLLEISQKIKQLPFVFEKQPQVVRLTDKTSKLYLFLDKKNGSYRRCKTKTGEWYF